jgi:hypothetical protein
VSQVPSVAVLTFATSANEKPFKDYSLEVDYLKKNAQNFELTLFHYNFTDLLKLIKHTPFEIFPHFQRGVGAWFWKPLVILDFLEKHNFDYVLYLDVDCRIHKNPVEVIRSIPNGIDWAGFKMSAQIGDWTASRVLRKIRSAGVSAESMWTAGILVIKNSATSREFLHRWLEMMSNPANLFDLPFDKDGNRHRHDQSLLSILIAQGKIQVHDLGSGFYSEGIESTSELCEDAWVSTGAVTNETIEQLRPQLVLRFRNQIHYQKVKLSRSTFWIHYLLDRGLKKIRNTLLNLTRR